MFIITPAMEKSMRNTQYPYGWETLNDPIIIPPKPSHYRDMTSIIYNLRFLSSGLWKLADAQLPNHTAAVCIQDLALIIEHIAGLVYDQINLRYQRKEQ